MKKNNQEGKIQKNIETYINSCSKNILYFKYTNEKYF